MGVRLSLLGQFWVFSFWFWVKDCTAKTWGSGFPYCRYWESSF